MFYWYVLEHDYPPRTNYDSSSIHRYIVITGVIFLSDTGVMAFIFLPKIKYAKEGLPEGMTVVESMNLPSTVSQRQRRGTYVKPAAGASAYSGYSGVSRASTGSEYGAERRSSIDSPPPNSLDVIRSAASNEGSLDVSQVPEMEERQPSQGNGSQRRVTFDMSESSRDGDSFHSALGDSFHSALSDNPGDEEVVKKDETTCTASEPDAV